LTSAEGKIRENLVRADTVDCIVALPAQPFYTTAIPGEGLYRYWPDVEVGERLFA
jgi:N-6 DNA Methylase